MKGNQVTTKHDDGGPAYPRTGHQSASKCYDTTEQSGMTLWDFYAAAALQGVLARDASSTSFAASSSVAKLSGITLAEATAEYAAEHADAMLAERRKRGIGT